MSLSLQQQIQLWSSAAEGLRDDVSTAELEALGKDIGSHAEAIWDYHLLITADAERLSAKAKEYAEAAKLQKNKAERTKDFLKYCLKSNGFTKLKAGAVSISLSEAKKAVAKRPATPEDFFTRPDLVKPKFTWSIEPTAMLWSDHPEWVSPHFEFDVAALKAAGRDELIEYEVTTRMSVKIMRET